VVWATGRRADHTTNLTNIVRYGKIKIVILDDHSKFSYYKNSKKWYPANTPISLSPLVIFTGIHSENLFYPLKDDSLTIDLPHRKQQSCSKRWYSGYERRRRFINDGVYG
jgi:thiamine pyrophosphokinase